ncbi:MAG: cyclase family protein [bacterium]|nr:cyclase family protein [bacterium]
MSTLDSFEFNQIIDVTLPLIEGVPVWPESTGLHFSWTKNVKAGDSSNLTRLDMDVHIGTHAEGPLHSFTDVTSIDDIPLDIFIGRAFVAHLPGIKIINAVDLEKLNLPSNVERLLLRTDNSEFWQESRQNFRENFVGLSIDAAQWIVNHKIRLVGSDYLSIANFKQGKEVHDVLLKVGIVIIEGLNLSQVVIGEYELICLPLKLTGREAAPARAVLLHLS